MQEIARMRSGNSRKSGTLGLVLSSCQQLICPTHDRMPMPSEHWLLTDREMLHRISFAILDSRQVTTQAGYNRIHMGLLSVKMTRYQTLDQFYVPLTVDRKAGQAVFTVKQTRRPSNDYEALPALTACRLHNAMSIEWLQNTGAVFRRNKASFTFSDDRQLASRRLTVIELLGMLGGGG